MRSRAKTLGREGEKSLDVWAVSMELGASSAEAKRLEDPVNHNRDHWKGRFMGDHVVFEGPADVQVEIVFEDMGIWVWRPGERSGVGK